MNIGKIRAWLETNSHEQLISLLLSGYTIAELEEEMNGEGYIFVKEVKE